MKIVSSLSPLLVCGAFAAAALVATAHAEPQANAGQDFEFKFKYNAADLQDAEKAEKILVRLERDVRRHCEADRARTLQERQLTKACVDQTMQASMKKFGSSTLVQVYESRAAG